MRTNLIAQDYNYSEIISAKTEMVINRDRFQNLRSQIVTSKERGQNKSHGEEGCLESVFDEVSKTNSVEFHRIKNQGVIFGQHPVGELTFPYTSPKTRKPIRVPVSASQASYPIGSSPDCPVLKQSKMNRRAIGDIKMINYGNDLGGGSIPLAPTRKRFSATPSAGDTPATPPVVDHGDWERMVLHYEC